MRSNLDESLNLLKELQVRLQNQQSDKKTAVKIQKQQRQQVEMQKGKHWGQRLATAYELAEKDLKEQNRRLKKHVNKLIRMNDYLKNQLVQGEVLNKNYGTKTNTNQEVEMLKLEIQYLHELNRQKELQIKMLNDNQLQLSRKRSEFPTGLANAQEKRQDSTRSLVKNHKYSHSTVVKRSADSTIGMNNVVKKKKKCRLCYS